MSLGWYILRDKRAVAVDTCEEWGRWLELSSRDGSRIVGNWQRDGVTVSTVFLGLDHGFGGGPPLLFETMIFGGPHDGEQWRFSTWEAAEAHHMEMCRVLANEARQSTINEERET